MRTRDAKIYRTALEHKQAELLAALRNREGIVIEQAADAVDIFQLIAQRELAISNLNREFHLLRAVRAALTRIGDGSYGICLRCEEPISPKRLTVLPWAAYCVHCQEAMDRGEMDAASDGEGMDLGDTA